MSVDATEAAALQPLRSKHTSNFPALLEGLGISVLVTTYQAGKLVILRSDGGHVNTHFRDLPRPMGLAADVKRLAVGAGHEIRQYRNMTPVCRRLEPPGRHDACYLPRAAHLTGDIDIHEMAYGQGSGVSNQESGSSSLTPDSCSLTPELWFVNTRFSCLCTLNGIHSFVPRWRPPFITALAPDDRCHLNGLGMAPDQSGRLVPRYVTALAATDTSQGWRDHKKDGGVLVEVPSGNIVARGLSMPHSPRWVRDSAAVGRIGNPSDEVAGRIANPSHRLWLLESGRGGIGYVDLAAGRYQNVAELPGFTRGLDIFGSLAFVGLSQVRESAVFSGIPIAERTLAERNCGVWVVDLRTGQTVAFLRFEEAVQEVFAVQVLPGLRYPEVAPEDLKLLADSYDLPSAALEDVPVGLRTPAQPMDATGSRGQPSRLIANERG